MTERQMPDVDPGLPPDPGPSSDPEVMPRFPKGQPRREASAETLADNTEVTPLDDDKNIEGGIEVNET